MIRKAVQWFGSVGFMYLKIGIMESKKMFVVFSKVYQDFGWKHFSITYFCLSTFSHNPYVFVVITRLATLVSISKAHLNVKFPQKKKIRV